MTVLPRALRGLSLALALALAPSQPAYAQDDEWGVSGGDARRDEMVRRYRDILENRPEEGPIFDRLLQELGGGSRFEAVVDDYRDTSERDPDAFAAHMLLGHLLKHAERNEAAREAYERAVAARPDDHRPHRSLGDVFRVLDLRDDADASYERALELADSDEARRVILRALADLAFEARDWPAAGGYVERLVAMDPDDVYTRMELAELFVRYERYDDALLQYEAIADAAGRNTRERAVALKDAGDVLALMGRSDEALERYDAAMRLVGEGFWLARELEQRVIALYRQDNRLEELVAQYEAEWTRPDARRLTLLATLYEELGREDDAIAAVERAVARDPRSVDTRLALIRMLERAGRVDDVVEQYRELVRVDREDASARFRLIDVYRRMGRRDDAVAVLDETLRLFGNRPHVLVDIADRYMRFGQRDDARAAYERLVRLDPSEPDNYVALGEFHFMDGRRSEAERVWRRILEVVPDRATAYALLGDVYADHGLREEAVIAFETAHEASPDDDGVLRSYARALAEADRAPDALDAWSELVARTDQPQLAAEGRTAMVQLYLSLGRLVDVLPEYEARFESEPADIGAGYFVALANSELGRTDRAEAAYLRILEHAVDDLTSLRALEQIYTEAHRHADAIDVLVRIAEAYPARARDTYHRLAALSVRIYDDAAAVRFAQLAVELNPEDAQAHARLGEIYRDMQRYEESVLAYRQALLLDPRAFVHAFDLAEIYLATHRVDEAAGLYRTILTEAVDETYVLRAGRRAIQVSEDSDALLALLPLMEPRLFDRDLGETFLRLMVELYERVVTPLARTARYGAGEAQVSAQERLSALSRRALPPLLEALAGDDARLRTTALRVLSLQGDPNAALPLARLLDDADAEVRGAAALGVARCADGRAVAALSRAAEQADTALLATWALGRTGDVAATPVLVRVALDRGQGGAVRALALFGLGGLPASAERDAAFDHLFSAGGVESELVLEAALMAAGRAGYEAAAAVAEVSLSHGRERVAEAAAWYLGVLPFEAGHGEAQTRALLEARVHATPAISRSAARALERAGRALPGDAALEALDASEVFFAHEQRSFSVEAYLSLARETALIGFDADAPSALARYPEATTRVLASALGLGGSPSVRALDVISEAPAYRAALPDVDRRALVDVLELSAQTPDAAVRGAAFATLARVASGSAELASAWRALDDPSDEVVVRFVGALPRTAVAESEAQLEALVDAERWQVRAALMRALGAEVGWGRDALDAGTADPIDGVRVEALLSLIARSPDDGFERAQAVWDALSEGSRARIVAAARASEGAAARALLERAGA